MPSLSGMVVWTDEQISDFVRKLGFLDAEGDTEWLIRQFLHLNQVITNGAEWSGSWDCMVAYRGGTTCVTKRALY